MTRIRFEDLPSTNTPINAENLNKLNNVIVSSEEPTTGEEVWIDNVNKKIHTKTNNGYEEFYNEEEHNKVNYSTSEQRIGTWLGKPLYRKVFEISNISGTDMNFGTGLTGINVVDIRGFLKSSDGSGSLPIPFILGEDYLYVNTTSKGAQIRIRTNDTWSGFILFGTLEYTKTTD